MIFLPDIGQRPPTAPLVHERILHVCLRSRFEAQPGLARALRMIATDYAELDWRASPNVVGDFLHRVQDFQPSLVFMQIQCATSGITGDVIERARDLCKPMQRPRCLYLNWDGDQHYEPEDRQREWFVELGRACDASLVVNTKHPAEYAAKGVRNPGYLQIGVDSNIYRPINAPVGDPSRLFHKAPEVVFLASNYPTIEQYAFRRQMVQMLQNEFKGRAGVHGNGWNSPIGRPMLRQDEEADVYQGARVAISTSIRDDLPRYTSDRLFRALGSGAVVAVQRFPDIEGLGLVDGENCIMWSNLDGLRNAIEAVMMLEPFVSDAIRSRAAQLVRDRHTWEARMSELSYIVRRLRGEGE